MTSEMDDGVDGGRLSVSVADVIRYLPGPHWSSPSTNAKPTAYVFAAENVACAAGSTAPRFDTTTCSGRPVGVGVGVIDGLCVPDCELDCDCDCEGLCDWDGVPDADWLCVRDCEGVSDGVRDGVCVTVGEGLGVVDCVGVGEHTGL